MVYRYCLLSTNHYFLLVRVHVVQRNRRRHGVHRPGAKFRSRRAHTRPATCHPLSASAVFSSLNGDDDTFPPYFRVVKMTQWQNSFLNSEPHKRWRSHWKTVLNTKHLPENPAYLNWWTQVPLMSGQSSNTVSLSKKLLFWEKKKCGTWTVTSE